MSRQQVQRLVVHELGKSNNPMSVSDLVGLIRRGHATSQEVSDFEIRSAVVALTAFGKLDMTSGSKIAVARAADERSLVHG